MIPTVVWCPAETQPGGWVRLRGQPELMVLTMRGSGMFRRDDVLSLNPWTAGLW